jgi:hypothetical protein
LFGFGVLGYVAQAFLRHLVQTESDSTAQGLVQAALGELYFNSLAAKVSAVCAESRGQPQVFEFGGVGYGIYWEHGSMNLEGAVESNQGAMVGDCLALLERDRPNWHHFDSLRKRRVPTGTVNSQQWRHRVKVVSLRQNGRHELADDSPFGRN